MIHIAVANEVNKTLKRNNKHILIGSIAPDIAKHIGIAKKNSHFQDTDADLPHLEEFLNKYKDKLNDDFVLGYYIHLYTDYLWFKYFEPDFYKNGVIYKLDGSEEYVPAEQKQLGPDLRPGGLCQLQEPAPGGPSGPVSGLRHGQGGVPA